MERRMMTIDQSYAGRHLDLSIGEVIELRLTENQTTGFHWTFVSDGSPACSVVADHSIAAADRMGQPGQHLWQLRGIQPGPCEIVLRYARSFETDQPPAQSFQLHIQVLQ
jgi:inhibitor of cysteine peptidase